MRFFHLSDLHIGKHFHHYNLKEDQKHILREIVSYAKELHPEAIVIAGDIYDKTVPSAEAVTIFDDFLTEFSEITPAIPVMIISGNHDSPERLQYASRILGKYHVHMSGSAPRTKEEYLKTLTLEDEHGKVNFYLLPFMKPSYVRNVFDEAPESYTDAVKMIIEREKVNTEERNVLVSHQFYTCGGHKPETCDSEVISVGGIDNVDISAVEKFDYVALGHIHGAQKVGESYIRYSGTPLKYSVSEAGHDKHLTMVTLGAKEEFPVIEELPLHPLHDVKKKKGNLSDVLAEAEGTDGQDYVSITLTDEIEPYRPKEQLENVYERILEIRIDNTRTRNKLIVTEEEEEVSLEPEEMFFRFFGEMQGRELKEEEIKFMQNIFEQGEEE